MPIPRIHCPSREFLRNSISQMTTLRGQELSKTQREKLIYDLIQNIQIVTDKTKDNLYCKPAPDDVNQHFDSLVLHLQEIISCLMQMKEELSCMDAIKAINYSNMVELNVAEFNFFMFKHHKEILGRYQDAHNILCHVDQCLNEIKSVATNRDTKQVFSRLLDYIAQLCRNLAQLCAKLEKNKISASTSSINSSSSSSYSTQSNSSSASTSSASSSVSSSLAGVASGSGANVASTVTKTAERLNMALNVAERVNVPIAPTVKHNFIGLGLAFAVGQLFFNRPNLSSKKIKELGESFLLEIKYPAIEQTGTYIHLKEYKSCIAMMVFDKILQKLLIEVQARLQEEEDEESESFCVWAELQTEIKKIKDESRHFQCICYARK